MSQETDLFAQLGDGHKHELLEHFARLQYCADHGIAICPDRKFTANFVRVRRSFLQWKRDTLASFAGVSLSTIERVERGAAVSEESLDRIAIALGYERGAFTEPRVPLKDEEAAVFLERCLEPFEGRRWIDVEPIRKQRQIAAFADCHTYLIDGANLGVDISGEIEALWEWIDFVSFVRCDFRTQSERERRSVERRQLYKDVLARIDEIERHAYAVALGGTYEVETDQPMLPKARAAIIGFFSKRTDPSALKRRHLLVPERISLRL